MLDFPVILGLQSLLAFVLFGHRKDQGPMEFFLRSSSLSGPQPSQLSASKAWHLKEERYRFHRFHPLAALLRVARRQT